MIANSGGHPLPLTISKQISPRLAPWRYRKARVRPTSIARHKLEPVDNQDGSRDHEKLPHIASEDRFFPLDQNTNHQSSVSQENEQGSMQTTSNRWRRRSGRRHSKDEGEEDQDEAQIDLTRQTSNLLASASWRQTRPKRGLITSRRCLLTALLFACCHLNPIQHHNQVDCLQTQFDPMTNTNQNSNTGNNLNLDGFLAAESRAGGENLGQLRPPLVVGPGGSNPNQAALSQLVSFLNSFNNQQQGTNNQRRSPAVQPLPLGAIGNQRQMGQPQPVSSTPVNPFVAAVNFQPTRRQQVQNTNLQFSSQNSQPQNPPALTLNRIASQFNNNNNQLVSGVANNRFTNSQQLPNLNLNSNNLNNGNNRAVNTNMNNGGGANLLVPQRNVPARPAQSPFANQVPISLRLPLMPPPSSLMTTTAASTTLSQQLRPISGFAPSGPPPNAASNNAINVVQSPANAIGSPSGSGQMMTPFDMPLLSNGNSNSRPTPTTTEPTPTTTTTTMPASTTSESTATNSQATTIANGITTTTTTSAPNASPSQSQTTTTNLVSSSEPASQTTTSSSSGSSLSPTTTDQEQVTANSNWNPVQQAANRTRQSTSSSSSTTTSSLAPSPDIVTVPPGYNPDQPPSPPQSYDIAVSAQMGPSNSNDNRAEPSITRVALVEPTPTLSVLARAPTETTTIIWSSETSAIASLAAPTSVRIQPTRTQLPGGAIMSSLPTATTTTSSSGTSTSSSSSPPQRIRDSSQVMMQNDEAQQKEENAGIVYGKASRESSAKPSRPPTSSDQQQSGRPFIQTAQLDTQVRPYSAQAPQLLAKSNHAGPSSGHLPFKPSKPLNGPGGSMSGGGGMSVGSGFSIVASGNQTMPTGDIQDYVAGAPPPIVSVGSSSSPHSQEPTISAQGGPDPATFDLEASSSSGAVATSDQPGSSTQAPAATPRLRRPTFKPKPAVPPIRIDSCIVGDDSSCDQSHNERCVTEYGISSCHCKPGFARLSQLRGYCSPISLLQLNLKIDRLSDDRKLAYNQTLENPNTEEYQYLEFETIQALASALQQTALAKQFMGARVNKFFAHKNKVWANVSLNLESNNVTRSEGRIQQLAQQELSKLLAQRSQRQPLGDSTILLDGSRESISKLVDINECANRDLNDCSKHATCTNEFGGYSCQCLPGYEDKAAAMMTNQTDNSQQDQADKQPKLRAGRICMGCSPAYCSNRGECFIQDSRKQCKCRPNFMGARCDIDSEVLAVAVGGALIGFTILIVSVWCLVVYNRRLRRDQHKMDAMSATSGLTYNYVNSNGNGNLNSSTNSLMSPLAAATAARHHPLTSGVNAGRSAGGGYTISGRFGSRGTQYQADQQAIIGSTSSGSSAASQPIACNPYAASAGYPYDDGLLIAPASTGSSEQTSPSANSYRGIMGASNSNHSAAMLAAGGNAYTLSGHHHHHHHHHQQHQQQQAAAAAAYHHHHQQQHLLQQQELAARHQMYQHHQHHQQGKQLTQFHPSALMDSYATRTLNTGANAAGNYCPASQQTANGYDSRWRTLAADNSTKQSSLAGYYLVR